MRKREIILDFTSLLDVTLIIIFFFVIFSDFNEDKVNTKMNEMESAIAETQEREEEAEALIYRYNEELEKLNEDKEIIQNYEERHYDNLNEILEFNKDENLKLILDMHEDEKIWTVRVIKGKTKLADIEENEKICETIIRLLKEVDYDSSKTVLCDFVYDGNAPGTASAYKKIKNEILEVRKEYRFFYLSETDLSVGGGE